MAVAVCVAVVVAVAVGDVTTIPTMDEWLRLGLLEVPDIVMGYDPGCVPDGIWTDRLVLGLARVSDDDPSVQVIPLASPHAPPVVSCTVLLRPFNHATVTIPCELACGPTVNARGEEVAEIPKSGLRGLLQPLNLNDPMAVLQFLSEVAG